MDEAQALLSRVAARGSVALAELSFWLRPAAASSALAARGGAQQPSLLARVADRWAAVDKDTRHLLLSHALSLLAGLVAAYHMRSLVTAVMGQMNTMLQDGAADPADAGGAAHVSPERLRAVQRRLLARGYRLEELSAHEVRLLAELVLPSDVRTRFADVGGQGAVVAALQERVVAPLLYPELFAHSHIAQRPTGVLLHGPPGCGKTLLARAMAHECRAAFLSISPSALEHKWVGDTPKAIAALFSLAAKLAPTIVFIDEIDGILAARTDGEQAYSVSMKSALLQHWDGLAAATAPGTQRRRARPAAAGGPRRAQQQPQQQPQPQPQQPPSPDADADAEPDADVPPAWVIVIGATNRPWALDEAAVRRMPRQIEVPLPDAAGRADILRRMLAKERCEPELLGGATAAASAAVPAGGGAGQPTGAATTLRELAAATAGCSGSDLAEVVREAVQAPIREALRAKQQQQLEAVAGGGAAAAAAAVVRAVTAEDVRRAAAHVRPAANIRSSAGPRRQPPPDSESGGDEALRNLFRILAGGGGGGGGGGPAWFPASFPHAAYE